MKTFVRQESTFVSFEGRKVEFIRILRACKIFNIKTRLKRLFSHFVLVTETQYLRTIFSDQSVQSVFVVSRSVALDERL